MSDTAQLCLRGQRCLTRAKLCLRVGGWRKTAEGGLETGGRVKKATVCQDALEIAPPSSL
ncbi:MAG: hypothetical protein LBK25_07345 [Treponema sp.]|nr:hypothetical protein [Treponema sp.]